MRRWGRVPICKEYMPEHELRIWTHETLLRNGMKGGNLGTKTDLQDRRVEKTLSQEEKGGILRL
jgi:hypothetical protein